MINPYFPLVTILCACKNELSDIKLALDSSISQSYKNLEIIFVDDSTDGTDDIIRSYEPLGVTLIKGNSEGCCQARNLGLNTASGEIVVFITADTRLDPDYVEKIVPYYEDGTVDYVLVDATSFNLDNIYSRYIEYQHKLDLVSIDPCTSQGYSVRLSSSKNVNHISGEAYPHNTCRDWSLGKKIDDHGGKKIIDHSIVVPHKSPDNFSEYVVVRETRGKMSIYEKYYLHNQHFFYILLVYLYHTISHLGLTLILVRPIYRSIKLFRYTEDKKDFLEFAKIFLVDCLQSFTFISGGFKALIQIFNINKLRWK